jgi:hypothetical protein
MFFHSNSHQNSCMGLRRNVLLVLVLAIITIISSSWGFLVHRTANQLAVYKLPQPMQSFFYSNMDYLVRHSVRPDLRRNEDSTEAPKHFIDLEPFGDSAAWKLPLKWEDAIQQFKVDSFIKYGYVPYHIIYLQKRLTHAFKTGNRDSILFYAADMSHYIGDAHVPLHTTLNYDGQLTNQKGIHSLWESTIPELELEQYMLYNRHRAVYLLNPDLAIWKAIRKAHLLLPEMFSREIEVSKQFPDSLKYRTHSPAFAKAYSRQLRNTINEQLRCSADLIADFWYTAWVDGGKPDLTNLLPKPFGKNEQKALKDELKAYKKNELIELKLLLSKQDIFRSGQ